MDFARLKKQFIREAKSSPKKVALLALVSGVAVWRIAPLLSGSSSTPQTDVPVPDMAAQASPAVQSLEQPPAPKTQMARSSWRELAHGINTDPLMQPAELANHKNPFTNQQQPPLAQVVEEVEEEAPPAPTLSAAGLTLSSTVTGARRKTALINGRTYGEGDMVEAAGAAVTVVSIRPRSVILESNGQQLELNIAERPASEKIQVRREQSLARSHELPEN